jgi:hypothetical protein
LAGAFLVALSTLGVFLLAARLDTQLFYSRQLLALFVPLQIAGIFTVRSIWLVVLGARTDVDHRTNSHLLA